MSSTLRGLSLLFLLAVILSFAPGATAQEADLLVTKTGPAEAAAGSDVSYDVAVTNLGPDDAMNVAIVDNIPPGMTFVSTSQVSGPAVSCATPPVGDPGTVTCTLATLAAGQTVELTFVFNIDAQTPPNATFNNFITKTSDTFDPNDENDTGFATTSTSPPPQSDMFISKSAPEAAGPGTDIVFTIAVGNAGSEAATGVELTDTLPGNLEFVSLDQDNALLSCSTPAIGAGGTITCTAASYPAGASTILTLTARVPDDTPSGTTYTNTAIVFSSNDPNEENGAATTTVTVSAVDLSVIKTGDETAIAGQELTYVITLTNNGPDVATDVLLSDVIPAGTTFVSLEQDNGPEMSCSEVNGAIDCLLGFLGPQTSIQLTLVVNTGDTTSLSNTASVTTNSFDVDDTNNSDTVLTTVTPNADLSVEKDGPDSTVAGEDVTYTITVTNGGVSTASNVSLTDALPAGTTFVSLTRTSGPEFSCTTPAPGANGTITCTIASLPAGLSTTYQLTAHIAPDTAGPLENTATVTSDTGDTDGTDNSSTHTAAIAAIADIGVTKDGPATIAAGTNITYTIAVTNNGPSDAASVSLGDALPGGTTFVSLDQSGPAFSCTTPAAGDNGTINCSIATLAAGATTTFQLVANLPSNAAGTKENTATVHTTTTDPAPANDMSAVTSTVVFSSNLAVTKEHIGFATAGETVDYDIEVTNSGPSDAPNVTLTDVLPPNTTFASLVQNTGPAFNCTTPDPGATGTVTCTLASFADDASATFTLVLNIAPHVRDGIENTATVSSDATDPVPGNNSDTELTLVEVDSDVSAAKFGPVTATAGSDITYLLEVTNNGPSDAMNLTITDTLPAQTTFVSITQTTGPVFTCINTTCTGPALAAGAMASFNLVVRIDPSATGTLENSFTVTAETDTNPGNNSASAETPLTSSADLVVVKTAPAAAAAGTDVTYTIAVRNDGPSDAATVTLTDTLPPGTTFVSMTQTSGPAFNCTATTCIIATFEADATATFELVASIPANATGSIENFAHVSSATTGDPDPSDNNSSASSNITASADVSLTKESTGPATPGTTVTYTLTARNNGPSDTTGVTLTDALPPNTTFASLNQNTGPTFVCTTPAVGANGTITCTLPSFADGATATFTLVLNVAPSAQGTLENTATISSASADPVPGNNSSTATTPLAPNADVFVTKSAPATATAGTDLTYTLGITNNGPSDAVNLTLTDTLPAGTTFVSMTQTAGPAFNCVNTTCSGPLLAAGATATFELVASISASATGTLENSATVTSESDTTPGNNTDTASTTVTTSADLIVTKTAPAAASAGTDVTYTIVVTNDGPSDAANVTLTDTLPAGTTFVSMTQTAGPAFNCATTTCTIAAFAADASATFELVASISPSATGTIDNTATVTSATDDPVPANDTSTASTVLGANADLIVTKSGPAAASAGTGITYTIVLTNDGPSDAANVTLTDTLPAETTFVSMTQTAGPAFNCATTTCTIAAFAADASATFELVASISPNATGTIDNTATVTSATNDPTPANNTSTASTILGANADLVVTKSGPPAATAGSDLTYTVTVTNEGPSDAVDVTLTDELPAQTTFVSAEQTSGPSFTCTTPAAGATGTVTCSIAMLAAESSATFSFVVHIAPDATGTIGNTASVSSPTPDPAPANSSGSTSTAIAAATTDVSITKTADASTYAAGATATYTLTVTNDGPEIATGVTVTDVLPAGAALQSATPTQGTCSGTTTVTCNLGFLDADATATIALVVTLPTMPGPVENTATVTTEQIDPAPANNESTSTISIVPAVAQGIPTLSTWMLILFALSLGGIAVMTGRVGR